MNQPALKQINKQNGFTIVELLIVIVVIVILVVITSVSYLSITNRSRTQAVSTDLQTTAAELTKHKAENGSFPNTIVFNSIKKANTSGETVYRYVLNAPLESYCLQANGHDAIFRIAGGNSAVLEGSCPETSSMVVLSPTTIYSSAPATIAVNGTASPGSRIIAGQCGSVSAGFTLGSRCNAGSTVSITVSASGTWTLNIPMVDQIYTGQTLLGASPSATNANCTAVNTCEMHILDFGTINNPTNLNQAFGSKTIPVYANIN